MKYFISLFFAVIINLNVLAQISFTETPQNYQLFPRGSNNSATVTIEGNITNFTYKKISLYVKKDNILHSYQIQNITPPTSGAYGFQLQTQIFALPVEYDFRVYLHNVNGDSTEFLHRERVVCGDIYVLYGQSNVVALAGLDALNAETDDRLLRNFDFDGGDLQVYSLKWFPAKQPYGRVGGVGLPLQKFILQEYGIPTCVINGGYGGLSIPQLNDRDPSTPFALHTVYGQLNTRVKYAKAIGKIKGIIWRQGEAEACSWYVDINNYPNNFTSLYNNLKSDLGNFDKFYNIQIAIHNCNMLEDAGKLREYMRKTKYLFSNIETSTALGIPLVDGFHHSKQGNQQVANEVFQMIKKDIYNANESIEVRPPDIQKIIKSNLGDTLTLVFQEGQKMKYPNDTTVNFAQWQMKNYLYVNSTTNSNSNLVNDGLGSENRIILKLNSQITGGYLTYLPSYSPTDPPTQEIHLKNSKGLRAMSFYQFPIANILSTPSINSIISVSTGLQLFFNDADNKVIERRTNLETTYRAIGTVAANTFIDNNIASNAETIYYRIKKESSTSESKYSQIKSFELENCNNNLVLSGNVTTQILRKGQNIESIQKILANSSYFFKKSVELKAGFETQANVTFRVDNSGCQ